MTAAEGTSATLTSLPAASYCQGEPFQHERRTVFAREWLLLARRDQLREPGEYVTANLGGWPLFALVDASGAVGAYRNVCRHQGMQVLEKPRGRCESVRCRYHGWTYDLSGRMTSTPELVAPVDPHSPDNHLVRVCCETLDKLLFVNLDRGASSLVDALAGAAPVLERALAACTPIGEAATDYNCNWKTYVEHALATRAFDGASTDGAWTWRWPLLMACVAADSVCVQQIVPRTFGRTRVVDHVFARDAALGAHALDAAKSLAAADKPAVEALQRAREAAGSDGHPSRGPFHRSLLAAYDRAPRDETVSVQGAR